MSLVNDMLTDLDTRDQNDLDEIVLIDRKQVNKPALEAKKNKLFFCLVLAIGAVGMWLGTQWQSIQSVHDKNYHDFALINRAQANANILLDQGRIDRHATETPILAEKQIVVREVSEASEANLSPKTNLGKEEVVTSISPVNSQSVAELSHSAVDEKQYEIDTVDALLLQAQRAFSVNKLTSPAGDNAFSIYQKILYSNPNNAGARLGIRNIAERYIALADDFYLRGEWDRAQLYDNKASYVASFYPEVAQWLSGISRPSADYRPSNAAKVVQNNLVKTNDVKPSDVKTSNFENSPTINPSSVTRAGTVNLISENNSSDSDAPSLKVERSKIAQEIKLLDQAKLLLSQGDVRTAESVLVNAQELYPQSADANTMLFDIYVASNRQELARKTLDNHPKLAPFESAFMESRLLVADQKNVEAIALLEKFNPNINEAADFYRLLAGLYQKEGRYAQSAEQYRKLLSIDNKQATYWLGLAVSLDALSDSRGALQAFQWVRQYGISDRETRAYVDQRIRFLSS